MFELATDDFTKQNHSNVSLLPTVLTHFTFSKKAKKMCEIKTQKNTEHVARLCVYVFFFVQNEILSSLYLLAV